MKQYILMIRYEKMGDWYYSGNGPYGDALMSDDINDAVVFDSYEKAKECVDDKFKLASHKPKIIEL